ncbi:hypothetical protein B0F90DRAFT_918511 [Multifurca ochricompacta]|uniref:Uncharacterized protein n=1 Tax=Multifurca ochricompacta TaxID=376703 RepID=A0AAD4QLS4_9AGAM|nr:hypothetical protein B0F90DRAFT_918511 [Multifurca ochricompacta]
MSDDSQGLFSTVLGFLSREVQDFVTTATGGSTIDKVVASTNPRHRPKSKSRRTVQHPRREVLHVNDQEERGEEEWPKQQHALQRSSSRIRPPRGTSYSPTPSPRCGTSQNLRRSLSPLPRKLSSRVPPHRRRETSPPPRPHSPSPDDRPSFDGHSDDTGVRSEKEEERTEKSFPRLLRRQPSFTMPGSLFPRSPSMVPEPSPAAELHVHFPTQPTYFDYEVPVSGPSSSPDRMRPPSLIPRRSRAESMGETYGRRTQEGENDRLMVSRPSWSEKGKQRATDDFLESEASSPARAVLTGRSDGAASDVELDLAGANTSGEIRVRGKERELSVMLEERRAREVWWEAEAETTVIREEKTEYEDKIKKLEEEVKRLREELARRPTMAPIDNSYWYSMPPPPPPPPPPPLVLPRIPMTPAAAEVSFSDIRAHLRHTGTPVEAPINAPSTAKRIGQPTIGVPADKMASFLKEMKTVRLRKVINAPADMGRPLLLQLLQKPPSWVRASSDRHVQLVTPLPLVRSGRGRWMSKLRLRFRFRRACNQSSVD